MGKHTTHESDQPFGLDQYFSTIAKHDHLPEVEVQNLLAQMYVDVLQVENGTALLKAGQFLEAQNIARFDNTRESKETAKLRCRMIGHGAVVGLCWPNSRLENQELRQVLRATKLALGDMECDSELRAPAGIVYEQLHIAAIPRLDALPVQQISDHQRARNRIIFGELSMYRVVNSVELKYAEKYL